jgi:hypothetical protein
MHVSYRKNLGICRMRPKSFPWAHFCNEIIYF